MAFVLVAVFRDTPTTGEHLVVLGDGADRRNVQFRSTDLPEAVWTDQQFADAALSAVSALPIPGPGTTETGAGTIVGPLGVGSFGSATPGEGTAYPLTKSYLDIMHDPSTFHDPPTAADRLIALRFRQAGFDHGMPAQDVKDAFGGIHSNYSVPNAGGMRPYGITTETQAWREVGIAGKVDITSTANSDAVLMMHGFRKDDENPDFASAIPDNANLVAFRNGHKTVGIIKGDGTYVKVT